MALSFETSRLKVVEIEGDYPISECSNMIAQIPAILTPAVVANLPPYFQEITSAKSAERWFEQMLSESRFLSVKLKSDTLIGFLFAYVEHDHEAHIGYLLAEAYWGQGLASELLQGFIREVSKAGRWNKLIGGVDQTNTVSAKLLKKLGFIEQSGGESNVAFFEYTISRS